MNTSPSWTAGLWPRTGIVLWAAIVLWAGAWLVSADITGWLLPSSDGTYLQWAPSTGTAHYATVDEATCNGNADYVSTNLVGRRDSYYVNIASIPNGSTITQIEIQPCASKNFNGGSSTLNVFYRFSGINSADAGNYALGGTTPVDLAITTFGGLSLSKTSGSTLQIGAVYSAGNKGARLSRIATRVTYTAPAPPAAPSNLTATNTSTSTNSVLLQWIDNATNEDGFEVERGTDGINFSLIATKGVDVTSHTDAGMANGTYYYRVRAFNGGGNSDYSNTASVTVP